MICTKLFFYFKMVAVAVHNGLNDLCQAVFFQFVNDACMVSERLHIERFFLRLDNQHWRLQSHVNKEKYS